MRKELAFFSIALKNAFAYKLRAFIWFLMDVLPALTQLLFFYAVFAGQKKVGSYSSSSITVYFIAIIFIKIVTISHPEFIISNEINQGFLSTYLIRPLSYIKFYFVYELAYKVLRLINFIPLLLLLYFLGVYNDFSFKINWWQIFGFLATLGFSYVAFYFMKIIIGFSAFWFTEIWWLMAFWEVVNTLFSGIMIPLDLIPGIFQKIASILPFKYLIFIPTQMLTKGFTFNQLLTNLIIQLFWCLLLAYLAKIAWRKGVKNYSAFGN